MTTYIYIARAVKGTPSNQYGSVDANTPKEAQKKVKDKYTYPVKVEIVRVPETGILKKTYL
ncbi:hypothetical protein BLL42_16030 [Pseudomonas frederiksbergensis]|uniref:Uncharacterized protein n=1 Tax=Pseudomonas frederiksbergensis TaxID=104087 RepID=A0A1J0EMJ8_9PSED|nr:hypothetical protein [Pseudomonas frederiksbergensis]APC17175.1 hypothetical protein BLL42_16030 [Pseudomonas frederiksbergensis]